MTKKQFEARLLNLEANGWRFIEIQPFAKYARFYKDGQTITIGKKQKI